MCQCVVAFFLDAMHGGLCGTHLLVTLLSKEKASWNDDSEVANDKTVF